MSREVLRACFMHIHTVQHLRALLLFTSVIRFNATCRGWQTAAAAAPAQKAPPVVVSAPTAEEIDRRRHHRSDKAARLARQREDAARREVTFQSSTSHEGTRCLIGRLARQPTDNTVVA